MSICTPAQTPRSGSLSWDCLRQLAMGFSVNKPSFNTWSQGWFNRKCLKSVSYSPLRLYPNKATNVWSVSWQPRSGLITLLPAILQGAGCWKTVRNLIPSLLLMRAILRLLGANHNMLPTVREQDASCSSQDLSSIILIDETKSEQKK